MMPSEHRALGLREVALVTFVGARHVSTTFVETTPLG